MKITLLTFLFFILASPLFQLFTPFQSSHIYILLAFLYILLYIKSIYKFDILMYIYLFVVGCFLSFYHMDIKIVFNVVYFSLSLHIASRISKVDFIKLVEVLTKILFFLLFLSVFALLLFLAGNKDPIYTVPLGHNVISFYYGTMTNTVGILRPAGIFLEPGAFSFFICMVVFFREVLGLDKFKSTALLFIGLITMSLTHVIILFIFALKNFLLIFKLKSIIRIFIMFFFLYLLVPSSVFTNVNTAFDEIVMSRLELNSDGRLSGDNRSRRLENSFDLIDIDNFFVGIGRESFSEDKPTDSNPLTVQIHYGFLIYIIYISLIFVYLFICFNSFNILYLIPVTLILQRPYLMSVGYAICFFTPVYMWFNCRKYQSR